MKGPGWRYTGIIPILLLVLGLTGCTTSDLTQSIFDPHGPVAKMQLELLSLTMWLAIGVFVVVSLTFFYIILRFRARPGQTGQAPQIKGNHTMEIAWTLAPIIILAIIGVPTVKTAFTIWGPAPEGDVVRVKAIGHQWWFEFQYPDEGFVTANEMVIPVGKQVVMEIESEDVIHSFWVPKLAGKTDMIPGRTNKMWFKADDAGVYFGQCAEYCGTSHARMRFRVIAKTEDEYAAWVESHKNPVVTASADNPLAQRGEALFMGEKPCYTCHAIDGTKAEGKVGPNLTNMGARTTVAAGVLENTDENLARWLRNPQEVKPSAKMPNLKLSEEEIQALVAYLHSLK